MTGSTDANPRHLHILLRQHAVEAAGLAETEALAMAHDLLAAPAEQTFKDDDRTRLTFHTVDGSPWIVKRFYASPSKTRLKQLVRFSPAWREWNGALQLHKAGVRVLDPIALITGRIEERCREAIVMPFGGQALSRWLASDAPPAEWTGDHRRQREAMAGKIGEQFGQLLCHGVINRDHKAANLLVDAACALGEQAPLIIDPGGLRTFGDAHQALRALRLLHKTATGSGYVRPKEVLRLLQGIARTHADLEPAGPHRLRRLARRILAVGEV